MPDECESDLLAALEAARHGPLTLLYEAGFEAGLERQLLLARTAAIYFGFCAGNLADDLADGDVDYLAEPLRQGPGAQYLLQSLSFAELAASGLPAAAIEDGARMLARSAALQQIEVRTKSWTAERYREVGASIAGLQWQAYLFFLWYGTALFARAELIGPAAGFVGFVVGDLRTRDARLFGMPEAERAQVMVWVHEALATLRSHDLRSVEAILRGAELVLDR